MSNIKNENLISLLNAVIDRELDKDVSQVNTSLVEECIDLVLKLEQEENSDFRVFVPLITSDEFLKRIAPENKGWFKRLNVFARAAVVAAIVATGTITVNATVKAITDYDILGELNKKIVSIFSNDKYEKLEDNTYVQSENEDFEQVSENADEPLENENKAANKNAGSTQASNNTSFEEKTESGVIKDFGKRPNKVVIPSVPSGVELPQEAGKTLVGVYLDSSNMKTNYIYGETFSYDGLELYRVYSDGSRRELDYSSCDRTANIDTTKTGNYVVKLVYLNTVVEIDVTVRPNEETRYSEICTNGEYEYLLTDEGAYITAYSGNEDNIVLDSVDSKPVVSIENGVFEGRNIKAFSSTSLRKVGAGAFANCTKLKTVDIPNVSVVENRAFEKTAVENIKLSSNTKSIGDYAFNGCEALKKINLGGNVETIGRLAFNECYLLEDVYGSQNIRRVGDFAFYDDSEMTVDSPLDRLCYVGDYAFAYCNTVVINDIDHMEHIGDGAFMMCYNIISVHITSNIKSVSYSAFKGARIKELTVDGGVERIEDYAFMSTMITALKLPNSVKYIGDYAFYTSRLTSVSGAEYVEEIGTLAFYPGKKLHMNVLYGSKMHNYANENSISYTAHDKNGNILPPEEEL